MLGYLRLVHSWLSVPSLCLSSVTSPVGCWAVYPPVISSELHQRLQIGSQVIMSNTSQMNRTPKFCFGGLSMPHSAGRLSIHLVSGTVCHSANIAHPSLCPCAWYQVSKTGRCQQHSLFSSMFWHCKHYGLWGHFDGCFFPLHHSNINLV